MKKHGILNGDISRVLSYMGHTDCICIGDCGLPVPEETERIDLAVRFGLPSFLDVLREVGDDMCIEKIVLAEEIKEKNPAVLKEIEEYNGILAEFAEKNVLRSEKGTRALEEKRDSMQGRYEALLSGRIGNVLKNAWNHRKQVRPATVICDVLIARQRETG